MGQCFLANARDKKSQGGYLIMAAFRELRKGNRSVTPALCWKSYCQDRQLAFTLGAELLSASHAIADCKYVKPWWCEAVFGASSIEPDKVFALEFFFVSSMARSPFPTTATRRL